MQFAFFLTNSNLIIASLAKKKDWRLLLLFTIAEWLASFTKFMVGVRQRLASFTNSWLASRLAFGRVGVIY